MDYKKTNAARTTISRDIEELSKKFDGNVYELISILKKRANQIGVEIKEELIAKLDEFATPSETLEEVFENQEQTEISRFYERLPKPTLIAIQEMLQDEIYMREPVKEEDEVELDMDSDILLNQDSDDHDHDSDKQVENTSSDDVEKS